MPLTRLAADAFGVVTIRLVSLLTLLGFLCIIYSCYFRTRIHSQGFVQLGYFSGPWIIRIIFILFAIWWGFGEIIRLSLLRSEGRVLNALNLKWQETVCKYYIVSNLGFAEPCLFLTIVFLLRAPLQKMESGILSQKWNGKTAGYVFLCCLPVFALQLIVILIGPDFNKGPSYLGVDSMILEAIVAKSVKAGDEVSNTYGSMGSVELLRRYGFTEPDNPNDVVIINLELVLHWISALFSGRPSRGRFFIEVEVEMIKGRAP
ncbi:uncharacterized protein LOC117915978 [Vitis riparia]|uniref:uncharacterized protein LOC117915978 n=1 Tax=Vitis riparia TaxID=96939 RepID=UPI00155AFEE3|nr:uncharacterized protein LOC117915978 [Vitis riparia]